MQRLGREVRAVHEGALPPLAEAAQPHRLQLVRCLRKAAGQHVHARLRLNAVQLQRHDLLGCARGVRRGRAGDQWGKQRHEEHAQLSAYRDAETP
jgi:hypothetical protein